MKNQIKTMLLLSGLTLLIVAAGYMFGGRTGMVIALIFAGSTNVFSYWYSDRLVLKLYKAAEVQPSEMPSLYGIVEELSSRAQLPTPRVYIIPVKSPNAFATGRNPEHAVLAFTEGLLQIMRVNELKGVIAHELSHIKNRDILVSTITATLAGAVMMLANLARWSAIFGAGSSDDDGGPGVIGIILMSVFAPVAAIIIQMGVSRSREYLADSDGAGIAGSPEGLADALAKLDAFTRKNPMKTTRSTAHMFIVNPLPHRRLDNLFSTHPPLEKRIALLRGEPPTGKPSGNRAIPEAANAWHHLSGQ